MRRFPSILLMVASLGVTLIIAEFALRPWLLPPRRVELSKHPEQGGLYRDTPTGRRLRPKTTAVIHNHDISQRRIEISTNSLGLRNPEIGPKTRKRILFLGDSITFGDYLPEEETFVRLVGEAGEDWETINAGVGGLGLGNEIALLSETGLALDPDVVVLGFYLNDFQASGGVHLPRIPRFLAWSWLVRHVVRTAVLLTHEYQTVDVAGWRADLREALPVSEGELANENAAFNDLIVRHAGDWGGAWSPHAWDLLMPMLSELRRASERGGFRLVFMALPVRAQVEAEILRDEPQQQLAAIAARYNVSFLDLLPALRTEWQDAGEPLFYDHCHHTPYGSRVVAEDITRFLRETL